jgi:hypothetical protein
VRGAPVALACCCGGRGSGVLDYWIVPLAPERLPMMAAHLLADGYDSPALREIAGMPTADVVVLREVFVEALRQLGVVVDGLREAQLLQFRRWVGQTLDETMPRAELVMRVCGLWEFDELAFGEGLPGAVRGFGLMCHSDEGRSMTVGFGGVLREVGRDGV